VLLKCDFLTRKGEGKKIILKNAKKVKKFELRGFSRDWRRKAKKVYWK
jgi:hypothetical protein